MRKSQLIEINLQLQERNHNQEQLIKQWREEAYRLTQKMENIQTHWERQAASWKQKEEWLKRLWNRISACKHNRGVLRFKKEWESIGREDL